MDPGPEQRTCLEGDELDRSRYRSHCVCCAQNYAHHYLALILPASLYAQNAATAGCLHVDPPALENLGFAWSIQGNVIDIAIPT